MMKRRIVVLVAVTVSSERDPDPKGMTSLLNNNI